PSHDMFDDDAMIFPEGAGDGLRYGVECGLELQFRFHNLPNLALWTKPGAPFLCIEPWHGMAATAEGGHEIAARPYSTILAPGAQASFGYDVTVAG
ncbi:MAG: aldose 1-epimerase family protein, partial [Rhodobacteraceae bacterium]|nr:aldose 1-epimerase family protein [Paracoccaceae bacterium]